MIRIYNKKKGFLLLFAGVYVEESTNCFDHRVELVGIIATSGERCSLGKYERKQAESILESISKTLRLKNGIYELRS